MDNDQRLALVVLGMIFVVVMVGILVGTISGYHSREAALVAIEKGADPIRAGCAFGVTQTYYCNKGTMREEYR